MIYNAQLQSTVTCKLLWHSAARKYDHLRLQTASLRSLGQLKTTGLLCQCPCPRVRNDANLNPFVC